IAHRRREIAFDDQVDDEEFQPVVIEGALKLSDDQAPEAEPPMGGRLGRSFNGNAVGWRFRVCSRCVSRNDSHVVARGIAAWIWRLLRMMRSLDMECPSSKALACGACRVES